MTTLGIRGQSEKLFFRQCLPDRLLRPVPNKASIRSGAGTVAPSSGLDFTLPLAAGPIAPHALFGSANAATRTSTPALREVPGSDIAVAAIVAGAAEDERRHLSDVTVGGLGKRCPCPLHERLDARAGVDRALFGGAHRFGGQDGGSSSRAP